MGHKVTVIVCLCKSIEAFKMLIVSLFFYVMCLFLGVMHQRESCWIM